jgi:receptor-type tyrosine-protein phosphatase zeta
LFFLGTAVSRKVRVRLAELGAFPIYDKAQIIQVRRGDSLKIPCKPPTGVPDPETYWTDNTNTADQFGFLVSNPRIQQDYYGNLYFLNVKDEDEQKQFICNVFSRKLNVIRRGALTQIQVVKSDPNNRRPMKLWTSEANKVFLKGYKMSLKCIFGGLPTPGVIWRKINGTIPERRSTVTMEKQELVITDLQFEDAGLYECRGYNGKKTFSIREEEKDLIVF